MISLEERAKVTEAIKAILDEGGSRLSATDIVRLKAGWETQSPRSRVNPSSPRNLYYPYNFLQTEEWLLWGLIDALGLRSALK